MKLLKMVSVFVVSLMLCVSVYAQPNQMILTDYYVELFLKVYPEYVELLNKSGFDENTSIMAMQSQSEKIANKFNAMLKKHDLTPEQFSALVERVTMAYTQVKVAGQMTQAAQSNGLMAGMSSMLGSLMGKDSGVSDAETVVIKKYIPKIEKVFEKIGRAHV